MNPSRQKTIEARRRSKKQPRVYREIADYVRGVRERLKMTQREFAELLGVSEISVRRWETALGHKPNNRVWERLKEYDHGNVRRSKTVHTSKR